MRKIVSILVCVFFLLIILSDIHYKIIRIEKIDTIKFTIFTKALILLFFLWFSIKNFEYKKHLKSAILLLGICLCAVISNLYHKSFINMGNVYYMQAQYFFGFIVIFFFLNYYKHINFKYLKVLIEVIIIVNFIAILAGFFFEIQLFKTYYYRFGYNGIFKSTSEASYFYLMAIGLYSVLNSNVKNNIILMILVVSSLFVGSKTLYLFLIPATLYYIFKNVKGLSKQIVLGAGILSTGVLGIVFLSSKHVLYNIYKNEGFLTAFFSYRSVYAEEAFSAMIANYSPVNYLFGGMGYIHRPTEMEAIDLYLTFGIIGMLLVVLFFKENIAQVKTKQIKWFMILLLTIIILRGNFLFFPSVIYIAMAIFAVILKTIEDNKSLAP